MILTLLVFELLTTASEPPSQITAATDVRAMLTDVNIERQRAGVPALALDGRLSALATERANDMVHRAYFSHTTPDERSPWDFMRAEGCAFHYAAENIARAADEREASIALWESVEHRENTLGVNYHKIGIGVAVNNDGSKIFVEDFTD
ncbi:MAG: CAP domain-containing protein [Vulcanimicrobiaceae bacterium]